MRSALQICPNDHPPFLSICGGFHEVLTDLGFDTTTVFFESRVSLEDAAKEIELPRHFVGYKDLPPFVRNRGSFDVILTHRYKGYRVALPISSRVQISLAHEFGMFARRRRRWRQKLDRKRVLFAGVSTAVSEDISRNVGGECRTLPNPINVRAMQSVLIPRDAARRALGQNNTDYLIGVVGRLHPKKNPLLAAQAFRCASNELGSEAKLIFVGDGELADRLQCTETVRVMGFIPNVRRYLRAFDLIVSTSTPREAFGMSLIEALVARVPVICTDQPGPREVLGEAARYVPDGDSRALTAALIEAKRAGSFTAADRADNGYRHVVDEFSISAVCEKLRPLID
jgi:glycosyltransferase involved in cell wall biosynthesis